MTGTSDRIRALLLAALVVVSVPGTTAALSGSVAAVGDTEPAVVSVAEDRGAIEIAFDTAVEKNETTAGAGYTPAFADDTPLDAEAIELYVRRAGSPDYDVYTDPAVRGTRRGGSITVIPQGQTGSSGTGDARYVVRIPRLGDLSPADDVKVNFTQPVDDADEEPPGVYAAEIGNVTVPTSSTVVRESGPGGGRDTAHGTRASGAQVYRGEQVALEANAVDTDVFVRRIGTREVVLDGSTGPNSRYLTLDSSDLRNGATYKVVFGGTSGPGKFLNVSSLGLEADLRQDGTQFAFDENVTLDVSATAVRGNAPILVNTGVRPFLSTPGRLDGRAEFDARYDEGTNRSGNVPAGGYTVTVTDVRTGVRAVAGRYSVAAFPRADAAKFIERVVTEDRGDVVEIPIRMEGSEAGARATLSVGDVDDTNYVTNLTVVDENGDGEVTVEWNTFTAGVNDLTKVFNVTGPDAIESWEWERGPLVDELRNGTDGYDPGLDAGPARRFPADTVSKNYTAAKNLTVDATTYELRVVADGGDAPVAVDSFAGVEADDAGQVSLRPNGVENTSVWVTGPANAGDVDLAWIRDTLDRNADPVDGNLTESDVATGEEVVVHRVEARGIEGVVRNRTAFVEPRGRVDETTAFLNETRQSIAYRDRRFRQGDRDGDGVADDPGELVRTLTPSWGLGYIETTGEFNRDPRQITINESTVEFVPDYRNDTYFVLVDLGGIDRRKLTDGRVWWANFSLVGQPSLSGRSESGAGTVGDRWEYQEPSATLRTGVDDRVLVRSADEQVIRGDTNVAPGTLLEVRTESDSAGGPFLETPVARVTRQRTFSVEVDYFADVDPGTNFTVAVRRGGDRISDEYAGTVGGEERASVSVDDQSVGGTDRVVVVDRATLSDGGFVAVRYGSATGPVIGASSYLDPGPHADVRVGLDETLSAEATIFATVHVDDDADNLFGFPGTDPPYRVNDTVVADSASVAVGRDTRTPAPMSTTESAPTSTTESAPTSTPEPAPTPTPRLSATPTPEPTPVTPSPTTAGEGGSGFGIGVVTAALAAVSLLGVRRRE